MNLAFKIVSVVLVEVKIPTFLTEHYEEDQNINGLKANLDLIEEKREATKAKIRSYQEFSTKHYNSIVKEKGSAKKNWF